MKHFTTILLVALILSLPAVNIADEKVLSLDEVISRAVTENLDVKVEALNPKIKEAMWLGEKSLFDTYFTLDLKTESSDSPQSSSFLSGGSIVKTDTDTISFGANQTLFTGTKLNFSLYDTRRENNVSINDLNPYASVWASLSFEQPLLKGFGIKNTKKSILVASNNRTISEAQFKLKVINTVSSAVQSYWNLIYFREDFEVKKQSLKLAEDLLEHTKIRVDVGVLPPIEIAQAEAGVASRKEAVIVAGNYVQQMEDALCQLLNYPVDDSVWKKDIVPKDKPDIQQIEISLESSTKLALNNRIELKNAGLMLQNSKLDVDFYRNNKLPSLSLQGSLAYAGLGGDRYSKDWLTGQTIYEQGSFSDAYTQIGNRDYKTWSIGISVSYPLFNRSAKSAYQTSRLGFQQKEFYYQQTEQMIRVEIRNAVRQLETDSNRIEAAKASRELQEKKLEAEEERYRNGLSTSYNVLDFQEDLSLAQTAELRAIVDYNKSKVALEQAQGTLLESLGIILDN